MSIVEHFSPLSAMSKRHRDRLEENAIVVNREKHTVLIEPGGRCPGAAFVIAGTIRVYYLSPDGKEITLYRVQAGNVCTLSAACLLGDVDYPAIAEVEDDVTMGMVPQPVFVECFNQDDAFRKYISSSIVNRMTMVMSLLGEVAFYTVDCRLAAWLVRQGEDVIKTTHERIASDLGTAREVVSRSLKALEKKGLIETGRSKIKVVDATRLEALGDIQ